MEPTSIEAPVYINYEKKCGIPVALVHYHQYNIRMTVQGSKEHLTSFFSNRWIQTQINGCREACRELLRDYHAVFGIQTQTLQFENPA
jgi:hypothetical protein